jgi:hypothetical protein
VQNSAPPVIELANIRFLAGQGIVDFCLDAHSRYRPGMAVRGSQGIGQPTLGNDIDDDNYGIADEKVVRNMPSLQPIDLGREQKGWATIRFRWSQSRHITAAPAPAVTGRSTDRLL